MKHSYLILKFFTLFLVIVLFHSCATQMVVKPPTEVKMMTTKQFETNKDLVFKSIMSLLQSESYIIDFTDKETGLIKASKRIENKKAGAQRFWLGTSKDANTSKTSFYVEEINSNLTEVKITLYEGSISTSNTGWGTQNKNEKESMVYDSEIYNNWFISLRAEIERRRVLSN